MNFWSLLATAVFAAETVLSPIPEDSHPAPFDAGPRPAPFDTGFHPPPVTSPAVSFGNLTHFVPQVLGAATAVTPTPTSTPTPPPLRTRKKNYTIALLGDSMIDTLGPDAPHLKSALNGFFSNVKFRLLNYGVGGTNIDYGLERITHDYEYLGNHISSLVSEKPDVVVVESFGYNPFPQAMPALDRHWLALASVVDALRQNLPGVKIVIAATIAPNAQVFGDGALNWSPDQKQRKVTEIKSYLENALKFAGSQHLPLADAYHPSLDAGGNGKLTYINPGDHIHYSDAGRYLMSQKIAEAIVNNRLLE